TRAAVAPTSRVASTVAPTPAAIAATPGGATPTPTPPHPADDLFDPWRFSYEPNFAQAGIQSFLDAQPGILKGARIQVGDRSQPFAEVLVGMTSLFSVNPKILLAMLEQQGRLLSIAQPSPAQLAQAMGYDADGRRGLWGQLRWAAVELRHAARDYPAGTTITFADGSKRDLGAVSMPRYALSRTLALTTSPAGLNARLGGFLETYTRLFGDPRQVPLDWPAPAQPFMRAPMVEPRQITSFFDHDAPFLQENGSLVSYWGRTEETLSYDGHTGWDYALAPPDAVLAAAPGTVIFAGNSDDGCGIARAVILDHRNGYRTLYWHLSRFAVEAGQQVEAGQKLGVAGDTGCVTGPHLHFQTQYLGRDVDPYGWCNAAAPDPRGASGSGQISVWLWSDRPSPCGPPPPGSIVVDDSSPGFITSGTWEQSPLGYGGGARFIASAESSDAPYDLRPLELPPVAMWRPTLPRAGRYRVRAYLPYYLNGLDDARDMRFHILFAGGSADVAVDGARDANEWADLGTYPFDPAQSPQVVVSGSANGRGQGVWADAVVWEPVP
ncbi:MAG: peptidoglycan DD-metalloendopeptidase family protein, partial [Chloroflexales bacterium]|nr:peptidoglycan DD-metalloendopeptidase family protein [Chloroflexales bacterium]